MNPASRLTSACLVALLAATHLAGKAHPAEAGWHEHFDGILSVADYWTGEAAIRSEQAVVLGGIALYRYRHTLSGSVIGCAAGAALGASGAVAAGLVTGGAALAGMAPAAGLGCGAGAAYGASLGYPLDTLFDAY